MFKLRRGDFFPRECLEGEESLFGIRFERNRKMDINSNLFNVIANIARGETIKSYILSRCLKCGLIAYM